MVHLNELHEKYEAKGLTIIAMSNESASAVKAFVDKFEAKYPVMVEESDTGRQYGVTGIPSAVLIGADGRVLYRGHPNSLSAAKLEEYLAKVRLFPELPKSLSSIEKAIKKDKFAAAYKKATKAVEKAGDDEEEKKLAQQAVEWIDWYGNSALESAQAMLEDSDAYGAYEAYSTLAKTFKGLPAGDKASDAASAIKSDKANKDELTSGKKWDKLREKFEGFTDKKDKKAISALESFMKKYDKTTAGKKAKAARQALYN